MSTSTILFLSAAACGVLFGLLAVYSQMRDGAPSRAVRWTVPVVVLAGCAAFGALAYVLDSGVAEKTLYEIDAEGSGSDVPDVITFEIPVEHPGAVHDVLVIPKTDVEVTAPANVRVRVDDPAGQVLLDESRTLDVRCDPAPALCEWDAYSEEFTPAASGTYELVVTLLTPTCLWCTCASVMRRRPTGTGRRGSEASGRTASSPLNARPRWREQHRAR